MLQLPSNRHHRISNVSQINDLIRYIYDESRERPILVLTVATGRHEPDIDTMALSETLGHVIDVVLISDDKLAEMLTRGFMESGHADLAVYQGAARLYPVISTRSASLSSVTAPLFFVDTPQHRDKLFDALSQLLPDVRSALEIRGKLNALHEHGGVRRLAFLSELRSKFSPTLVTTPTEARELATFLLSSGRCQPMMIISHTRHDQKPFVDVELLSGLLHGIAYVVEIVTPAASSEFRIHVAPTATVYGEAGRVYPTGTLWNDAGTRLRLFIPNDHISRMLLTNLMAAEALSLRADDIRSSDSWSDQWNERWGGAIAKASA